MTAQAAKAPADATHKVTVNAVDRRGLPPKTADAPEVFFQSLDGETAVVGKLNDGHITGELPAGEYVVFAPVNTPEDNGKTSTTIVYLSRFALDEDRAITLDARKGKPVKVATDRADAAPFAGWARIVQKIGGNLAGIGWILNDEWSSREIFVTPTGPAPGLELRVTARLTKNGTKRGSPYVYNVAGPVASGVIPDDPSLRVRTKDLAEVRTEYADQGRPGCSVTRVGDYDRDTELGISFPEVVGELPATRTEYFTPRAVWDSEVGIGAQDCAFTNPDGPGSESTVRWEDQFPAPGKYTREWNKGPFGPGPGDNLWEDEETARFDIRMKSTWSAEGWSGDSMTGSTTLRDAKGKVLGTSELPGEGDFPLPPERAKYRLTTDAVQRVPWSDLSTRQHAEWTFTTQRPTGEDRKIPLPTVALRTRLDSHNRAPAGADQPIELDVRTNPGRPRPKVGKLSLWASHDDGATWTPVTVRHTGGGWRATVRNSGAKDATHMSLRARAETTTGETVDQTIVHAYGLSH
ncbi:hypothetical protein OHR68_28195 [Spirillospora sp. NBC_00431]